LASRTFIDGAPEDNETFVINNFVRDWGHTFIYDEKTLRGAMTSVGFAQITKFDLQESHASLCAIWKMKPACRRVFYGWKRSPSKGQKAEVGPVWYL
jgi:hypothetical protein